MTVIIGNYILNILKDNYSWNENCGENGSHATSSVSLSVRPVDGFLTYLMTAEGNLPAVIKDGSTVVFSGIVRPYTGTSFEGNYQDNISLEIMDNTETLHQYIYPEPTDGKKDGCIYPQVWKGKTLSEMTTILFELGGQTVSGFSSSELIPYFKLEGEQYLDDVISELLFEFGYDYKWSVDGKAIIFPTFVDDVTIGTISDVRGNYSISRSDDTTDGLKVTWKEYAYLTNVPIFSYSSGNQTFNAGWEAEVGSSMTLSGKLYSGVMHDSHFNPNSTMPSGNLWTWNFPQLNSGSGWASKLGKQYPKIDKDSVLFVKTSADRISVGMFDEIGINLSPTLESYDTEGMRMWVDYSGRFNVAFGTGWTWKITVYGDVGVGIDSEASYNIVGANPETKELKYRLGLKGSKVISDSLVKQLYLRSKYSKITYSFSSLSDYELGAYYTSEGNTIRIISKTKDADGIYTYRGEGCKPYSDVTITVNTEQQGNNRATTAVATSVKTVNSYATSTSKVTAPTEGWSSLIPNLASSSSFLWTKSRSVSDDVDEESVSWSKPVVMAVGVKAVEDKVAVTDDGKSLTTGEDKTPVVVDASQTLEKESITREEIDTQSLMAGELTINNGGIIHSDGYTMGDIDKKDESGAYICSSGFGVSSEGAIEAISGRMRGVVADDLTIVSGAIETINEEQHGTLSYSDTFPTDSSSWLWQPKDVYNTTLTNYASLFGVKRYDGTVVYNGVTTSYGFAVYSSAISNLRLGIYKSEDDVKWYKYDLDTPQTDDIQITVDGAVVLQIGPSYSTWIGASRYALFSGIPTVDKGFKASVTSGTYKGVTLSSDWTVTRGATSFSLSNGATTYKLSNGYIKESSWPSYNFSYVSKPKGVYISDLYPQSTGVSKIGGEGQEFAEITAEKFSGDVNESGTKNSVYGAKFTGTVLLNESNISNGGSYPLKEMVTNYEWITVLADVNYTRGIATFHSSLYSQWTSENTRLVIASDSEYLSIYFCTASSVIVRDKSSAITTLKIIGYK